MQVPREGQEGDTTGMTTAGGLESTGKDLFLK